MVERKRRTNMSTSRLLAAATAISALLNIPAAFASVCEEAAHAGRFIVRGDEVLDTTTNLTWQRCSVGQHLAGEACSGTVETVPWEQAKKKAGAGWRLPTLEELSSIVSQPCGLSTEDKKVFPGIDPITPSYWSVTATEKDLAWTVGFNNGSTFNGFRTAPNAIRLVKGGR
jgi:hypothetical protein